MPIKTLLLLTILAIVVSACGATGDDIASGDVINAEAQIWLDAPLDGMVIPLAPYKIVFHSTNTMLDAQYEVSINGEAMALVHALNDNANGDDDNGLWYGEYLWEPPAPGTYLIEIRVLSDGQASENSASAMVIVLDIPEPDADQISGPGLPIFDTDVFYYRGSCAPQQVTVDFMVTDPDIFNVVLFMRLEDKDSGEKTAWSGVAMNHYGNEYYRRVISSSQIPGADMYKESYFQVQIVVTRDDGSEIMRTEVIYNQVTLIGCGQAPPPIFIPIPTSEPTPIPPPN